MKGLVDTGFYGDVMVKRDVVERLGLESKYKRVRMLPNGVRVDSSYGGGEITTMNAFTYGDIEVWDELRLPTAVYTLIDVTAL